VILNETAKYFKTSLDPLLSIVHNSLKRTGHEEGSPPSQL